MGVGYLKGRVDRVLHQSGSYYVISLRVEATDFTVRDKSAKISGYLCGLERLRNGSTLHVMGEWIMHPKWGRQFAPHGWFPWAETTRDIERFLNECVSGFEDFHLVRKIVTKFGLATFDVLTNESHRILEAFPDAEMAVRQWQSDRALSDLAVFLRNYEMGPETVTGIYSKFGREAIQVISDNPYRLIAVDGFPFSRADQIASRMKIPRNDPRRIEGALLWVLRSETQQGHLYVRRGDLPELVTSMVREERADSFDIPNLSAELAQAVDRMAQEKVIQLDPNAGIYLPELYHYERQSAAWLAEFLAPADIQVDLSAFLTEYEKGNQIDLSEAQRDAVRKLAQNRVLVLTGLPGTGKTTVIRTFVRLFKQAGMSFLLMTPTGIAAKRLAAVTGEEAQTIHRAFGYNGFEWAFNGARKFDVSAVIVDECSMVDQELFFRILDALNSSTMLVLVGDDAQLPSVGPGNVLRELIACPEIPNVRLTQIFRQAETSDIVLASHKINRGEWPIPDVRRMESEFQFVPLSNEEKIVDFIVEAATKLKARDANFQVLSPKYEGTVGVNNLNSKLRDRLNPKNGQAEWKAGLLDVREGDRLMVIKNNYELNIYNGDMGKLVGIGKDYLRLRIHGVGAGSPDIHVNIPKELAPNILRLAYAITVHKCQGSEFETILLPLVRAQGRMLQRNLFYTGVTRARKKVWLLGEVEAIQRAVANDRVVQRNTVLGRAVSERVKALGVDEGHDQSCAH